MSVQGESRGDPPAVPEGVQVAPSILAADFSRLGAQVDDVLGAGAKVIHVDVMDGRFVPPITIGPLVVASLADRIHAAGGFVDVHLMIADPSRQIDEFARAGADAITVHVEADPHAHRTMHAIREAGCLAGIALNPGTSEAAIEALAPLADLILVMSVNPGWGGQRYIERSTERLGRLADRHAGAVLEVDGGIDSSNATQVVAAGAKLLVAGSAVFAGEEPGAAYAAIAARASAGSS